MNVSIIRIGDTFSLGIMAVDEDEGSVVTTANLTYTQADELQTKLSQQLLDWHYQQNPADARGDAEGSAR